MVTYSEMFKATTIHDPYPYQTIIATRNALPALLSLSTGDVKAVLLPAACCHLPAPPGSPRLRRLRGASSR